MRAAMKNEELRVTATQMAAQQRAARQAYERVLAETYREAMRFWTV